jgi:hypothetical protein
VHLLSKKFLLAKTIALLILPTKPNNIRRPLWRFLKPFARNFTNEPTDSVNAQWVFVVTIVQVSDVHTDWVQAGKHTIKPLVAQTP